MTRLHLCQSSSARCTRRCLRRNGRSGIGGVSEAAGRESPPHRESATSARPARTRQSQGGPIRPHCSRPLPQAHSHCRNFAHQSAHLPSRFLLSHQSATSHQHPLSLAGPSRRQSKASLSSQHRILIDQLSEVCQEELTRSVDKTYNKVSNNLT